MRNIAVAVLGIAGISGMLLLARLTCLRLGYSFIRKRSREKRMLALFNSFFRRMQRLGLPDNIDSQSPLFIAFCEEQLNNRRPELSSMVRPIIENLYLASFGPGQFSEKDIQTLRKLYLASFRRKKTGHS